MMNKTKARDHLPATLCWKFYFEQVSTRLEILWPLFHYIGIDQTTSWQFQRNRPQAVTKVRNGCLEAVAGFLALGFPSAM